MPITKDQLRKLAARPSSAGKAKIWDAYVDAIASPEGHAILASYGVETGPDVCHFLANVAHETGGFTIVVESGAYSEKRIIEIFGVGKHSAAVTPAEAKALAALPMPQREVELFDRVYGIGNPKKAAEFGHTKPGDGWRYRGRSCMQYTGKNSYARAGAKLGLPLVDQPELLENPINGLKAAAFEWREKGCSKYAREDNARMVRRLINGGYNGMADVEAYLAKAKKLWWKMAPIEAPKAPAPAAPKPAVSRPKLKPGDVGEHVRELQRELVRLGYWLGDIDGDFGPRTIEALLAFKRDPRNDPPLELNEIVDAAVWAALAAGKPRDLGARQHMTVADVIARSKVAEILNSIHSIAKRTVRAILAFFGINVSAKAAGVDLIDTVLTSGGKLTQFLSKLNLPAGLKSTEVIVLLVLALMAIVAWVVENRSKIGIEEKVNEMRAATPGTSAPR